MVIFMGVGIFIEFGIFDFCSLGGVWSKMKFIDF